MKIVGAPTWVVRFLIIVICVVGAVSACTSTGDGPAIGDAGPDATQPGTPEAGTPEAGADAGSDKNEGGPADACVPPVGVATFDAGPLFGCYQTACASELSACAADCVCNAAIMSGLQCIIADAGSAQSCFYPPIFQNTSNPAVRSVGTCLQLLLSDGGCERSAVGPHGGSRDAALDQTAPSTAGEGGDDASGEGSADASGDVGNDVDESDAPAGD